ncbi:MAG: NYN domain-containing protein [bacterium]
MKRVMVFIDGSNLYHALKKVYLRANVDFEYMLANLVTPGRELIRAYYYNAPVIAEEAPENYRNQQRFFSALKKIPYFEIKLGRLVRRQNRIVEKGVDVKLAVDMVSKGLKNQCDVAILVSGDSDFAEAVQIVKDAAKHVEVAYPLSAHPANELLDKCDVYKDSEGTGNLEVSLAPVALCGA